MTRTLDTDGGGMGAEPGGAFMIGVNSGQTRDSAIAVVELRDDSTTRNMTPRHAVRDVLSVRGLSGVSFPELVREVADVARPLGENVRVIADVAGSVTAADTWRDARRRGELVRWPLLVTVMHADSGAIGLDMAGFRTVSNAELVFAVEQMVKTRGFTIPQTGEGVEELIHEVTRGQLQATPKGRFRFTPHERDARLLALALALYPRFHTGRAGRRLTGDTRPELDPPANRHVTRITTFAGMVTKHQ